MTVPGSPSLWWIGAIRAVLPQRGALANAREAVQHDRWAAAQRREVAQAVGRVGPHPAAAPVGPADEAWPAGWGTEVEAPNRNRPPEQAC